MYTRIAKEKMTKNRKEEEEEEPSISIQYGSIRTDYYLELLLWHKRTIYTTILSFNAKELSMAKREEKHRKWEKFQYSEVKLWENKNI